LPFPKYLETPFTLDINADGEVYKITGKIDRIDQLNGGVEIIDYKTGARKNGQDFGY
jgi:RecB family exonuclease